MSAHTGPGFVSRARRRRRRARVVLTKDGERRSSRHVLHEALAEYLLRHPEYALRVYRSAWSAVRAYGPPESSKVYLSGRVQEFETMIADKKAKRALQHIVDVHDDIVERTKSPDFPHGNPMPEDWRNLSESIMEGADDMSDE